MKQKKMLFGVDVGVRKRLECFIGSSNCSVSQRSRIRRRLIDLDHLNKKRGRFDSDSTLLSLHKEEMRTNVYHQIRQLYDSFAEISNQQDFILIDFLADNGFSSDDQILEILEYIKINYLVKGSVIMLAHQHWKATIVRCEIDYSRMLDNYERFEQRKQTCVERINTILLELYRFEKDIKDAD